MSAILLEILTLVYYSTLLQQVVKGAFFDQKVDVNLSIMDYGAAVNFKM